MYLFVAIILVCCTNIEFEGFPPFYDQENDDLLLIYVCINLQKHLCCLFCNEFCSLTRKRWGKLRIVPDNDADNDCQKFQLGTDFIFILFLKEVVHLRG